ncbi:MAG: permease, partial [Mycobacterium sp.]
LNIVFLTLAAVLVAGFVKTGGMPMMRMMGGSPADEGDHHDHGQHCH